MSISLTIALIEGEDEIEAILPGQGQDLLLLADLQADHGVAVEGGDSLEVFVRHGDALGVISAAGKAAAGGKDEMSRKEAEDRHRDEQSLALREENNVEDEDKVADEDENEDRDVIGMRAYSLRSIKANESRPSRRHLGNVVGPVRDVVAWDDFGLDAVRIEVLGPTKGVEDLH